MVQCCSKFADFEVYFLRHGETTWNRASILQGSVPGVPLTEKGRLMAVETGRGLRAAGISFDRVYTSPLRRARDTAALVLAGSGPEPIVDDRLHEISLGAYEGLRFSRGPEMDENLRRFFDYDDAFCPRGEGAESFADVRARLTDFLEYELRPLDGRVTRVLCVTHANILKSLERLLADGASPKWGPNCCMHVVRFENGRFTLGETGRIFYDPARFDSGEDAASTGCRVSMHLISEPTL